MTYRARREARAARLREWAAKRAARANEGFARAHDALDQIPFGQPVMGLRDRNYRDRANRTFERAVEDADKARSMASRASNIEEALASSIYDDDPDAIERLEARIARAEAEKARIKAYNASCRRGVPDPSLLDEHQREGLAVAAKWAPNSIKQGYPSYALTNINGRIAKDRQRLARLQAQNGKGTKCS